MRPSVVVGYQDELGVAEWIGRHDNGEVPGRWPYGLDHLADHGVDVTWRELRGRGRLGRALSRLTAALPGGGVTLLTWDESTAVRAAGRRFGRHVSGVIWLTDRPDARSSESALRTLRRCERVWVLSAAQVEPLEALLGRGGPGVEMVSFGIDADFYGLAPYPERPLVVSAGGDRDRDAGLLLEALATVHDAVPEAEIIVQSKAAVTPPPGVAVVASMSHVQLRELYERMSVMVLATRPNLHVSGMTVALESMAVGRPVVITESPGLEDYVPDATGCVEPRSAASIADAVIGLLRDPDEAASMGLAGRRQVESHHTQDTMAARLADLVQAVSR